MYYPYVSRPTVSSVQDKWARERLRASALAGAGLHRLEALRARHSRQRAFGVRRLREAETTSRKLPYKGYKALQRSVFLRGVQIRKLDASIRKIISDYDDLQRKDADFIRRYGVTRERPYHFYRRRQREARRRKGKEKDPSVHPLRGQKDESRKRKFDDPFDDPEYVSAAIALADEAERLEKYSKRRRLDTAGSSRD